VEKGIIIDLYWKWEKMIAHLYSEGSYTSHFNLVLFINYKLDKQRSVYVTGCNLNWLMLVYQEINEGISHLKNE